MSKKKLLFVGPWPPPFGGIASHLYELLPGIVELGYEVITLSYIYEEDEIHKMENGVRNIYFSPSSFFKKNLVICLIRMFQCLNHRIGLSSKRYSRAISISERINRIIVQEDISYVFTYDNDQVHVLPFIKKNRLSGLFCTIYGAFFLTPEIYGTEKPFLRHAIGFADKILSCSMYCASSGREFLHMDYPIKVIYNNVDKEAYNPSNNGAAIRKKHNIPDNAIVLMTMGRVGVDMGVDFLLKNIDRLTSIDPRLIIFIVGAKAELSDKVEELAKNNYQIRYAFNIDFEDKPYYFASCDIFTAPTKDKHACMGIANIEAMMSGKAVISSNSGGHPETIEDNLSGILVPFRDGKLNEDIYIEKLSSLVNDDKLRDEFGKSGRERALRLFTNEQIVQEHIDLINEFPLKYNR
jgi:glycosyltransferase involved in cell wall biosynthesis